MSRLWNPIGHLPWITPLVTLVFPTWEHGNAIHSCCFSSYINDSRLTSPTKHGLQELGSSANHNHTRQAESRLVQVPDRWGLLLGRRRLSWGGWSDRLGCHRHFAHWSVIQATRNPSQLRQLQNTRAPRLRPCSQRPPPDNPPDVAGSPVMFGDGGLALWRSAAETDVSTGPDPRLQAKAS